MNNERRNRIAKIVAALQELSEEIEAIRADEQDAFDNMPEGLQASERGEQMQEAISALEGLDSEIENIISSLEGAME